MRLRLNPHRAGLFAVALGIWLLWGWLGRHARVGSLSLSLPDLDQRHTVAAFAILCIAVVGIIRIMIARR